MSNSSSAFMEGLRRGGNPGDSAKIKQLIGQGYHVEVINPDGNTFDQKYRVWQNVGWDNLKVAVIGNNGSVTAVQG